MRKTAFVLCIACVCGFVCGCESVARKFVRKPREPQKPHEVLLEPVEYGGQIPGSELYDQYFLYWKSWHDEFITALSGPSHKRQADTVREALKNLREMRRLLDEQARKGLDGHIRDLESLDAEVAADIYCAKARFHAVQAEKIRRQILSGFSPGESKGHIVTGG